MIYSVCGKTALKVAHKKMVKLTLDGEKVMAAKRLFPPSP